MRLDGLINRACPRIAVQSPPHSFRAASASGRSAASNAGVSSSTGLSAHSLLQKQDPSTKPADPCFRKSSAAGHACRPYFRGQRMLGSTRRVVFRRQNEGGWMALRHHVPERMRVLFDDHCIHGKAARQRDQPRAFWTMAMTGADGTGYFWAFASSAAAFSRSAFGRGV